MVTVQNAGVSISGHGDDLKARMLQLNRLRKSRHFCDVVLQVGTAEVHAHRAVLSCASAYFFELFTKDDDKLSSKEDKVVYKLSGHFQQESLELLVQFAYTGDIELQPDMVKHVYVSANKLKMEQVVRACGQHLLETLTPDTCLSVRNIPGVNNDIGVVEQLDKYIQEQDLIRVSKDVSGVTRLQMRVIQNTPEEVTSYALGSLSLEWIRRQMTDEEVTLGELLEKKHLLYLNLDNSLHDCCDIRNGDAQDTEMVQDYKKISRKLSKTNIKASRKLPIGLQPTKPRMMLYSRSISDDEEQYDADWKLIAHSQVAENSYVAIVTLNGVVSVLSIMQIANPPSPSGFTPYASRPASVEKADSYTLIPHMNSPKCAIGTGSFNGNLLVCGGYDRGECLKEVEVYSPKDNSWKKYPDMKHARGRFDLTVLDGLAYAVGGCDGTRELSSVEVLDKKTKTWSKVTQLPLARSNPGVCSTRGKVFCIGGWNGYSGIKQSDAYDPNTKAWTSVAPLHTGRYQCGVVAIENNVYAVGGCDSWNCLSSVEILDVDLNIWRMGPSLNTARRGCGLAYFKGKLFVVGGSDGTQSLCSTEVLDLETNTWAVGPSMTTCRANVGTAVVDGKLYAVGGFSGKTFLNTIEYLDPITMEWTNFTPKPEGYVSKRLSSARSSTVEVPPLQELQIEDSTIAECLEGQEFTKVHLNGFLPHSTNVH